MTEPGQNYPLLLFPEPVQAQRETLPSARPRGFRRYPTSSEQGQRLGHKWAALQAALANRTAELATDLGGTDPELVLVIEIIGGVDGFYRAVRRIEGLEFLAEVDEDEIDGDGVFVDHDGTSDALSGSLYLLATNQRALDEILQLWRLYQADEDLPRNFGRWKQVFQLLSDVRRWSPQDRLRGTGALEDFAARQAAGQEVVPAEIELWYREDPEQRAAAEAALRQLVERAGGEIVSAADIGEIAYHALLVSLPIQEVEPLLSDSADQIELIRAEQIAFLRPEMQAAVDSVATVDPDPPFPVEEPAEALPVVGMLDGLPLANHELLGDRIIIDDPDDWSSDIPASARVHGTAIASLILHGDGASDTRSLHTPVYARPVLRPEATFRGQRETMPHDTLPIDLVHRAVLRMVGPAGVVPSVRIINLSLGDANSLANRLSPWARLLDWLSYHYRVLFIVSAGNHTGPIQYPLPPRALGDLSPSDLRRETVRLLVQNAAQRRLLSPAECMNGLCIGAAHHDNSCEWVAGSRRDILPAQRQGNHDVLFSPVSAAGMGYRRTVKPDLLAPGGRMLFRFMPGPGGTTTANPVSGALAPGLKVASPAAQAGALRGTQYFHGTSGAAAIASHLAGLSIEELSTLETETGDPIDPRFWAVLAKTLLVHAAELPESAGELRGSLDNLSADKLRDAISRFYGYGLVNPARVNACTAQRATALGWGELEDGEAAQFDFPLPPSLAGKPIPRRLSLTVGYFSPIRSRDRRHRAAELFIRPDRELLRLERGGPHWRTVRRGTLQHEVLSGDRAAAYVDGDSLRVVVNCRSVVGTLREPVLFGLAMTLEVDALAAVPVYAEVADRIQLQARARARARA